MPIASGESRVAALVGERKVSGAVMIIVLGVAFGCGLVGFAIHTLWVVTVIVLALGLGFALANARQAR